MDCSPLGFSAHGILQTRILEWVAICSCRGSSWSRDWTHSACVSCIGRLILYHWTPWEAILQICGGFSVMHTLSGLGSFLNVKVSRKIWTTWFAWFLWGFLDQVNSTPFLEVTSSCLLENPKCYFSLNVFFFWPCPGDLWNFRSPTRGGNWALSSGSMKS